MAIQVINAVIHGFDKDQHTTTIPLEKIVIKKKVLDVQSPPVKSLVEGVAKLLGTKLNTKSWGRFDVEKDRKFYREFNLKVSLLRNDDDFLDLTKKTMVEVIDEAQGRPASTGSKILFSSYLDDSGKLRLLIAMIKQKGGIRLDEDYVPLDVVAIDMSKLSQAAEIYCDDYLAICAEEVVATREKSDEAKVEDEEIDLKNYLSFLASREQDASGYFIKALNCVLNVSPKKSTASVIKATEDFFRANKELQPFVKSAREAVCKYLQEKIENKLPAKLEDIVHLVKATLPPDLVEKVEDIGDYYNNDEYRVPAEFYVHNLELNKHIKVVVDADDMQLKFNRSVIGVSKDSRIFYDRSRKTLTIKNLTQSQMEQLDRQVS